MGGQPVLAELFTMSEVGLFPSYKEPFGMVFVECFACGCPAIGAKSGGPTEFVTPEQGVLVEEEKDGLERRLEEDQSRRLRQVRQGSLLDRGPVPGDARRHEAL